MSYKNRKNFCFNHCNKMTSRTKKFKPTYEKKDPISHILDRPDMYVGLTENRIFTDYSCSGDGFEIEKKTFYIPPALSRIFIEPLSNVIDNVTRSRMHKVPVKEIRIDISEESGETSFRNDGEVIPIELHPEEKCYNHTMIFGQLLTSSNYDDTDDRVDISGRNGLGVKLCLKTGTILPTFDGSFSRVEDLKIGSVLIGKGGEPAMVTAMTTGRGELFEIKQKYGDPYIVNRNHLLTLCVGGNREEIVDISVEDYLALPQQERKNLHAVKSIPVWEGLENLEEKDLYRVGYDLLEQDDFHMYIHVSFPKRLDLLAGIIDKFGVIGTEPVYLVRLGNRSFVHALQYLARACGLHCEYSCSSMWSSPVYRIKIFGSSISEIPTKDVQFNSSFYSYHDRYMDNPIMISPVEEGGFVGIQVDGGYFSLSDFTVTHNCNIFSREFRVEGGDSGAKLMFSQRWTDNMKNPEKPEVEQYRGPGYTKVTFFPDFSRFGIGGYTTEIINYFKKLCIDASMVTKIPIIFNGVKIPVSGILEYSRLYGIPEEDENDENEEKEENKKTESLYIKTSSCEVVITPSKTQEFEAISFANGVYTPLGGTHVDSWVEALLRPLVEKVNKPKKPQVNIGEVKRQFRFFITASVIKPTFESQSKLKLESPVVEAEVKKTHITVLSRWSTMETLENLIRMKELSTLKKTERKKRGYTKVEGLEPANNEGGKKGRDCTLILVEGLSAKNYASNGLECGAFGRAGRDWFGIYDMRGKVLNCRNAKVDTISKNRVVDNIIKALGVQYEIDYELDENFEKLRYGRVLLLTDADTDGFHISGLVQNMFHALFPSLLKRSPPFLTSMQTPVVRVFLKGETLSFYDEYSFQEYERKNPGIVGKNNKKYYKGLASSNVEDVQELFGKKLIEFVEDPDMTANMNKAFHSKYTGARKAWLEEFNPDLRKLEWVGDDDEIKQLSFSDFINTELIKFSIEDCKRSIPNVLDGLKEGHRKILRTCFSRKIGYGKKVMKAVQLANLVSFHTAYHHGEQNLENTVKSMANCFVGANNIPLLYRDGLFGTRAEGGKDAGSGRYIFTKLDKMTRLLFREEDDELLTYLEDDGQRIEPVYYLPILPMVLVNGCIAGIGTGWSCSIPCYNPLDLIACVKAWLENMCAYTIVDDTTMIAHLPEIKPWYRGFNGEIVDEGGGKYISWGRLEEIKGGVKVTELPVGLWTSDFIEMLEGMKEEKQIQTYKNYTNPTKIDLEILEGKEKGIKLGLSELKLQKTHRITNMVLFSEEGKLKRYESVDDIIDTFCKVRYELYVKRKQAILGELQSSIKFMGNKRRFLQEVIDGDLVLFSVGEDGKRKSRKKGELCVELEERGYDKIYEEKRVVPSSSEEEEEDQEEIVNEKKGDGSYNYLLKLQFSSITEEKIEKLKQDIANKEWELEQVLSTSEKEMWVRDLDEFEKEYIPWTNELTESERRRGEKLKKKGKK